MQITPLEIAQQQFRVRFRGFDVREVDNFLEKMADAFETIGNQNKQLQEEIRRLKRDIQGFREREESFKRAMLNSQKLLDQVKENAHKAAELITTEAEVHAQKLLNGAHNRLAQLHEDIAELKRQRMQIEVQIRSVLEAHTKLLEMGRAEMEAVDQDDSKLKFLARSR
ncbi:MAG: DivIVA domain-containing protein [Desulfobacterales bacterium]|jgi:cell division initiation protein|nr:DivIVA domain-containing protein [Desulfobacterales bacterium]